MTIGYFVTYIPLMTFVCRIAYCNMYYIISSYRWICISFIVFRQLKAKCDALEKHLFDCESEKNTNKKQLADAMVFLRETINEQEALLRRAAGDGRNDASAAMLSASISARVKALTEHLKVYSETTSKGCRLIDVQNLM